MTKTVKHKRPATLGYRLTLRLTVENPAGEPIKIVIDWHDTDEPWATRVEERVNRVYLNRHAPEVRAAVASHDRGESMSLAVLVASAFFRDRYPQTELSGLMGRFQSKPRRIEP